METLDTVTLMWAHRVWTLQQRYLHTEMPAEVRVEVATLESCRLQVRAALAEKKEKKS